MTVYQLKTGGVQNFIYDDTGNRLGFKYVEYVNAFYSKEGEPIKAESSNWQDYIDLHEHESFSK